MNISVITKVKILMFIKWSYRSPLPPHTLVILFIEPSMVIKFEHTIQSLLSTFVFGIQYEAKSNHTPLKYTCLIKRRNRIRQIYLTNTRDLDGRPTSVVIQLSKSTTGVDLHSSQVK